MKTGSEQLAATLRARMESDPSVVVLGEALELSPVTSGLLAAFPGRVHLLPAAELALWHGALSLSRRYRRPAFWRRISGITLEEVDRLTETVGLALDGRPPPALREHGIALEVLSAAFGTGAVDRLARRNWPRILDLPVAI